MRIISGRAKGRILKLPRLKKIRFTSDKVKEALFDILGGRVMEACFLELFAGSGSVGIESLSRGAKTVVFVDNDDKCIRAIKENLRIFFSHPECPLKSKKASGLGIFRKRAVLLRLDAFRAITFLHKQRQKFNIVFLDPPYYQGWVKKSLINLARYDILKRNAIIVAEHSKRDFLPTNIKRLRLVQQRKYSDTILSFYKKTEGVNAL